MSNQMIVGIVTTSILSKLFSPHQMNNWLLSMIANIHVKLRITVIRVNAMYPTFIQTSIRMPSNNMLNGNKLVLLI